MQSRRQHPCSSLRILCVLATYGVVCCIVMAQSKSTIDDLLLSNEFKAEQRAQLQELPMSAVVELTNRLNTVSLEDPKTGRLFEFLVVKTKQFEGDLSPNVRAAAIRALEAKADNGSGASKEYRASLLKIFERGNTAEPQSKITSPEEAALRPVLATPTPATPVSNAAPPASTALIAQTPASPVEQRSPLWPWVVGILVLGVIVALALKRRE